ncbi:MAG TPA: YccF domain-containing protein [Acidimicrobiia bacterium]|nr:YccF domain-containing protein [Acidimicrobiia bacterium]
MTTLGNILWLLLCGIWMSVLYFVAGVVGIIFIVTIPLGLQAFKLANYVLWPFGRTVIRKEGSSGFWALVGNVVWIILDGWWLAVAHLLLALVFFVTIVGIPFAIANVKLARLALTPFGLTVVEGTAPRGDAVVSVSQLGRGSGTARPE